MRMGVTRYTISETEPPGFWTELNNPPTSSSFEEAIDKNYMYVRLLIRGVPEQGAVIKKQTKKEAKQ